MCLAMSYSHMGRPHTTIGDKSFDGQEPECRGGQDARERPLLSARGNKKRMGSGGSDFLWSLLTDVIFCTKQKP